MKQYTVDTPYPVGPVHFYVQDYKDFSVLFDTGPNTDIARKFLKENVDLHRIRYTFITHCHVDHYGLLDFIKKNSDSDIIIPESDYLRIKRFDERKDGFLNFIKSIGFNDDSLKVMEEVLFSFKDAVTVPDEALILEKSQDILNELNISFLPCPGHSTSDIVYLVDEYAISGDVILRDIFQTPLFDMDPKNFNKRFLNYEKFCETVIKLKRIENKIFLPGHREYIDSIDERIIFYLTKLFRRTKFVKDDLHTYGIFYTLKKLINDIFTDPFKTYIKLSELFFINDFISNPDTLINSLKEVGLYNTLKNQIEKLFA